MLISNIRYPLLHFGNSLKLLGTLFSFHSLACINILVKNIFSLYAFVKIFYYLLSSCFICWHFQFIPLFLFQIIHYGSERSRVILLLPSPSDYPQSFLFSLSSWRNLFYRTSEPSWEWAQSFIGVFRDFGLIDSSLTVFGLDLMIEVMPRRPFNWCWGWPCLWGCWKNLIWGTLDKYKINFSIIWFY